MESGPPPKNTRSPGPGRRLGRVSACCRTGPAPLGAKRRPPLRRPLAPDPSSRNRRPASRHPTHRAYRSAREPTTLPRHPHCHSNPFRQWPRGRRRHRSGPVPVLGQRNWPSGCRRRRRRTRRRHRPHRWHRGDGPPHRPRRSGRRDRGDRSAGQAPARRTRQRSLARTASALPPRHCWRRCARPAGRTAHCRTRWCRWRPGSSRAARGSGCRLLVERQHGGRDLRRCRRGCCRSTAAEAEHRQAEARIAVPTTAAARPIDRTMARSPSPGVPGRTSTAMTTPGNGRPPVATGTSKAPFSYSGRHPSERCHLGLHPNRRPRTGSFGWQSASLPRHCQGSSAPRRYGFGWLARAAGRGSQPIG